MSYIEKRVKLCIKLQEKDIASATLESKKYTLEMLEQEIEKKTLEIYNLTPDDIKIVEDFCEKK